MYKLLIAENKIIKDFSLDKKLSLNFLTKSFLDNSFVLVIFLYLCCISISFNSDPISDNSTLQNSIESCCIAPAKSACLFLK